MKRWINRIGIAVVALAIASLGGFYGYASYTANRTWDAPLPPITADMSPNSVARGAALFEVTCAGCHVNQKTNRFTGAPLVDIPKFLGTFHSANLTSHPTAGIGARSDQEIARMIRYGVKHDGRRGFMPTWAMSDSDVAAILGYLRTPAPAFAPDSSVAPASRISRMGAMVLTATGAFKLSSVPPSGVIAPPKGATPEYGRYLAEGVYDCGGCHTAGFSSDKMAGETAFAGGFEFADAAGHKIWSSNITFDESGIAGWTLEEFQAALNTGLRRDGSALRFPMQRYRRMDAVESEAIYRYLQTLPKRHNVVKGKHITGPALAGRSADGAQLYAQFGCATCHDEGAPYREQFVAARGKSASDLAKWIRNPEAYKPGTAMPTYASMLSEADAEKLAKWIVGETAQPQIAGGL